MLACRFEVEDLARSSVSAKYLTRLRLRPTRMYFACALNIAHNRRDGSGRQWRTASSSHQGFRPPQRQAIPKDRSRTGAEMSVPRSVAEVLAEHITLEVEAIDRNVPECLCSRFTAGTGCRGLLSLPSGVSVRLQRFDGSDQQGIRGSAGEVCAAGENPRHLVP